MKLKQELKKNKRKLRMIQKLLRELRRKKLNLKLVELLLSFSYLQRKSQKNLVLLKEHGIKEHPMMLLEVKLPRPLHPKLLMRRLRLPKTKRLLLKLPMLLPNLPTLAQQTEKVLMPTLGMSNGLPRLFHNHSVTLIVLTDN